ncbi:MAG: hypothetical protein KBD78_05915 [Oligoflexales bacterium]|nr:hypothetical protein [Oligoflexales bacterium]
MILKNVIAVMILANSLQVASFAQTNEPVDVEINSEVVEAQNLVPVIPALMFRSEAAELLYAALNVEATNPEADLAPTGGINPMIGVKVFETSYEKLVIECESRLSGTSCKIQPNFQWGSLSTESKALGFKITSLAAKELYDALDLPVTNPEYEGLVPVGFNPLRGLKQLIVEEKLNDQEIKISTVSCEFRMISDECVISVEIKAL